MFFKMIVWVVFVFGMIGLLFIIVVGFMYFEWCCCLVMVKGEGYGLLFVNELECVEVKVLFYFVLVILLLIFVGVLNFVFMKLIL